MLPQNFFLSSQRETLSLGWANSPFGPHCPQLLISSGLLSYTSHLIQAEAYVLSLAYVTQQHVLRVHLHCDMCQDLLAF